MIGLILYCLKRVPISMQTPTPQFWHFCGLWGPLCNRPLCRTFVWSLECKSISKFIVAEITLSLTQTTFRWRAQKMWSRNKIRAHIILFWASAQERSQLKHQKLRFCGYMEEVFEWFDYLRTNTHPRCEDSSQDVYTESTCIVALTVVRQSQPDSGERCIVLQVDRLIASLPSFCSIHCLQYTNFVLQTKNAVNKATDRCVRNFDAGCRGPRSVLEWLHLCTWAHWTYFLILSARI